MNKTAVMLVSGLCSLPIACASTLAAAQSSPPPGTAAQPTWAVQVTPYVWASGLKGDISPFRHGPTMAVDKSFSEVMSDFNVGGFINVWGRSGRAVFSGDVMYVSTSNSQGSGPLAAFQIPGLGVPIPPGASATARVDSQQLSATLQAGWRIVDAAGPTLDLLAGARYWRIATRVKVQAGHPAIGTRSARHAEDFHWVDPLIGLRAFLPLTRDLSLQLQADVGGFGVGAKYTWSALATANYAVSNHLSVSAGYKALHVDYARGGHVYKTRLSGPVVGLTYRF